MLPDLKSLQLFVAIADCGSISEAARRMHLALAAASKRISVLEYRAGTQLLHRHARGIRLSAAGEGMLVHARATLASLERLQSELGDFQQGVRGIVRVAANGSAMSQTLPAEVGRFLTAHPGIHLHLKEMGSGDTVRALRTGQIDIGIFESTSEHIGIETRSFRSDRLAVVVPMRHPLSKRKRLQEADIFSHELIGLHESTALNQLLAKVAAQRNQTLKIRVQTGSFDGMCRLIEQGLGIGVLPEDSIAPQRKALNVKCIALDAPWALRQHLIGCVHEAHLTAAARSLLTTLSVAHEFVGSTPPVHLGR